MGVTELAIEKIRELFGLLDAPDEMWAEVEKAYDQPTRRYHNLEHLEELGEHFCAVGGAGGPYERITTSCPRWRYPDEIAVAMLYHDYYCDPLVGENEQASVRAAMSAIARWLPKIDGYGCFRIRNLILATATHGRPRNVLDPDMGYFVDADMAILGSSPERFKRYQEEIAAEYQDLLNFAAKRKKWLCHVLRLENIYVTPFFRGRFEAAARRNICSALGVERGFVPRVVQ